MEFGFLFVEWLGKPAWMWLAFFAIVAVLLTLDLGLLHKEHREIEVRESLILSARYIGLGKHWCRRSPTPLKKAWDRTSFSDQRDAPR